jgi:hypothetical protein
VKDTLNRKAEEELARTESLWLLLLSEVEDKRKRRQGQCPATTTTTGLSFLSVLHLSPSMSIKVISK